MPGLVAGGRPLASLAVRPRHAPRGLPAGQTGLLGNKAMRQEGYETAGQPPLTTPPPPHPLCPRTSMGFDASLQSSFDIARHARERAFAGLRGRILLTLSMF